MQRPGIVSADVDKTKERRTSASKKPLITFSVAKNGGGGGRGGWVEGSGRGVGGGGGGAWW